MLTERDRAQLEARGITVEEAHRQMQLLRGAPPFTRLDRPCTVGDGIVRLDAGQHAGLLSAAAAAAAEGRVSKFVPASGAATRMFKDLIAALASDDPPSASAPGRLFFDRLDRFPFAADLRNRAGVDDNVVREQEQRHVLRTLLHDMQYGELPKALIAFHRVGAVVRTPFEEHLLEGTRYTRDRHGRSATHFTVAPEFHDRFAQLLANVRSSVERLTDAKLDVQFSEQHPSTDTLAATPQGDPFRVGDGTLLLRPAGHGALLRNLQQLNADIVVIKNIDNVQPFEASDEVVYWKQLLIGCLVRLLDERRDVSTSRRPVRVCGVVRNEGEPGGAPFWVVGPDGERSLQIVESAQVDLHDAGQREIFEASTHFNPVDLVCGVRAPDGTPYDLSTFVDHDAVFRSTKSYEGRELIALERPGLWNGSMARWHTMFVEVPASTFAPVKTVFDLLRPQHQSL
jgi:hypothetical protein